jgi:hypothetical protein
MFQIEQRNEPRPDGGFPYRKTVVLPAVAVAGETKAETPYEERLFFRNERYELFQVTIPFHSRLTAQWTRLANQLKPRTLSEPKPELVTVLRIGGQLKLEVNEPPARLCLPMVEDMAYLVTQAWTASYVLQDATTELLAWLTTKAATEVMPWAWLHGGESDAECLVIVGHSPATLEWMRVIWSFTQPVYVDGVDRCGEPPRVGTSLETALLAASPMSTYKAISTQYPCVEVATNRWGISSGFWNTMLASINTHSA